MAARLYVGAANHFTRVRVPWLELKPLLVGVVTGN